MAPPIANASTTTNASAASAKGLPLAPLLAIASSAARVFGVPLTPGGLGAAIRGAIAEDPMGANAATVFGGAYLFWLAERDVNPKCESYYDALVFVSTCLSVGYADVFARTKAGKAIATAIMTLGPALSGVALDAPAAEKAKLDEEQIAVQRAILGKLEAILGELKAQRA